MDDFVKSPCGGELRARVLTALWSRPARLMRLRALAATAGVDPSNMAKLLPGLIAGNLCERTDETPSRYRAAQSNPAFAELAALFGRAAGDRAERPLDAFAKGVRRGARVIDARTAKAEQQQYDAASVARGDAPAESMYLIPVALARAAVVHYRDVGFDE
jgi:hypothetical protein